MSWCGSPRPAPLCPGAFSMPTRDGGTLWGFWPQILSITRSRANWESGIPSRRSGLAAFPSSCSCSQAVLREKTLFL